MFGPIYYSKDTNNITCGACAPDRRSVRNKHPDRGMTYSMEGSGKDLTIIYITKPEMSLYARYIYSVNC